MTYNQVVAFITTYDYLPLRELVMHLQAQGGSWKAIFTGLGVYAIRKAKETIH